ncbi:MULTISPECIES: kynureninase [Xanthomonas]|uniref:Kynureninase n=1 Tax=Xanthomonas phaseoli pv. dieffenbachiae TaxID=92828 RepID=A0A1V9H2Z5_9XANT|nr:kynureninase [Xanthomonas phaseoli]MBO9766626.1 kynureninase [Xanthomonas phaseoli pv. dieffenbachiae]MBO9776028.1 kynureninase [Xanthomonas phaseoli pv. dieffenbachiae]MBO9778372.1 kynureninase [Xanthomonas phaseoli pv. dieffenbachiae]MBO9788184.1 kynureninase [Xanthomonas phaseoli pv. dieffenbachiae]MBO9795239.1 kynureninase [Xanthomonas phaseoli pv. dieffenbachiae]
MTDLLSRAHAAALDAADPLRNLRDAFVFPQHGDGDQTYFVGNSLGLQPRAARAMVEEVLDQWGALAVEGHFTGPTQWLTYHQLVRDGLARVVGAQPGEVVAMNTLSVNLHLMMASFYRPTAERGAILIEAGAFPSDRHAVESQLRLHGLDPATHLIEVDADEPNGTVSMTAIAEAIAQHGPRLALVLWPGIQYRTGQAFDLAETVRLARAQGAAVGFDLAHAVGNLPLTLHDDGVDFAVWCHYKYLNAGPGAVGGCFVHARHAKSDLPRMAGWWGHEQQTRFRMDPQFVPSPGAEGWQLSNPPVLALAPLRASLAVFDQAGMAALRTKSEQLTGHLEQLIHARVPQVLQIVTPAEPARRGCQLSLRVAGGRAQGRALFEHLHAAGVLGDWREPDVIRIAPVPLYNRFSDLHTFVEQVEAWAAA